MGYAIMLGQCIACKAPMSFHPHKVPSIRVNGIREPVCKQCIETANVKREEMGLEKFRIPDDAYAACDESEL